VNSSDERSDELFLNDDVCSGSVFQLCDRAAVAPEESVGEKDVFYQCSGLLGGPWVGMKRAWMWLWFAVRGLCLWVKRKRLL
jgi:hypothetical protein